MTNNEPVIIALKYAIQVYNELYSKSEEVDSSKLIEFGYPAQADTTFRLYKGHSTKSAQSTGLRYTSAQQALRLLNAMQCITKIRSGGKNTPSLIILNYAPTRETYLTFKENSAGLERRILPSKSDIVLNEIVRLRDLVLSLENRISALESKVMGSCCNE